MTKKKSKSHGHSFFTRDKFLPRLIIAAALALLIGFTAVFTIYLRNDIIDIVGGQKKTIVESGGYSTPKTAIGASETFNIKMSDTDHIRGNKDAKITIIEFADFQCPFSLKFHNTMKQVIKDYPDTVKWIYRHFPLRSHKYARSAAEASECAGDQNKFWEYADELFNNQTKIDNNYFSSAAEELKLNIPEFENCLSSGKYSDKVNNDYNQGKQAGVTGAPGNIINGELVPGAVSYEKLKEKIEKLK
ncbi:MAG: thioredoxin domain-containing protein [Actinobacteria bacterium]|nr:thioredoxin domain-containing protein [Actinomycetota bacterium]